MKQKIFLLLLITSILVLLPGQTSGDELTITQVGGFGTSEVKAVAVQGNYAYCAVDYIGLEIYDISTPGNPVPVGRYSGGLHVSAVAVSGNYAVLATYESNYSNLHILNVSDPTNPTEVKRYNHYEPLGGDEFLSVHAFGNYVYGKVYSSYWVVDMTSPGILSDNFAHFSDIDISGQYLYMTVYSDGLKVADVTDPLNYVVVSDTSFPGHNAYRTIAVQGNYAYIGASDNRLLVVDISQPTAPTLVHEFSLLSTAEEIDLSNGNAFVRLGNGIIEVLDISVPTALTSVGTLETDFPIYNDKDRMDIQNNTLYLADDMEGLTLFDIATAAEPQQVGAYDYCGTGSNEFITENYAYLSHGESGLRIIDISTPTAPVQVGHHTMGGAKIVVSGNYAYTGSNILDVSNPASPVQVGSIPNYLHNIYLEGNYLYGGSSNGLGIVDISDPYNPQEVGEVDLPGFVKGIYVKDNMVFAATENNDSNSLFEIIDVTNPASPVKLISYQNMGYSYSEAICGKGNTVFVVNTYGLHIVDVSNPTQCETVAVYNGTHYLDVKVVGDYAFLRKFETGGIVVLDISTISSPVLMGSYTSSIYPHATEYRSGGGIDVSGKYAYFVDGLSGLMQVLYLGDNYNLPPELSLDRSQFYFGAGSGTATVAQNLLVENSGASTLNWWVSADQDWLEFTPASGTGSGEISLSVDATGLAAGNYSGTLTVGDYGATNSPQTVAVSLTVYDSGSTSAPFGEFLTPAGGTTVRSSVPFTGWALDDVGIAKIELFRDINGQSAYIGDALLVEGARPDVAQAYPGYPANTKAGWGYMMLTNFLPEGDGVYTIHAIATDMEGNQVDLGSKTITVDNAVAVKPFGAIDSPEQGGAASGSSYVNSGWALTPQPNMIPTDGSTIHVWVDGVSLGNPVYNRYREDIAGLFPDYENSGGASGYFYLDTTAYSNGVHTIAWSVEDDAGNVDGIGSRYFTVRNLGSITPASVSRSLTLNNASFENSISDQRAVEIKKGFKRLEPQTIYPDDKGIIPIELKELERLEMHIGGASQMKELSGCQMVGLQRCPLPVGSVLDMKKGILYWQPGPGFVGVYRLLFEYKDESGNPYRKEVVVKIRSRYPVSSNSPGKPVTDIKNTNIR
ncbi:MAG: hypothetical protein GY757_60145 [bacterium]|nr:hypothetical protein [bacterium]